MLAFKELKKLKLELLNSLVTEAKESLLSIPKAERKKSEEILQQYIETESIAGLELWVSGVSESIYFSEAKKDLEEIKKKPHLQKEFQIAFTENLKTDFGVEDFRFLDWERANSDYSTLSNLLEKFLHDALKACYTLDHNVYLGEKSDYSTYRKTEGDPSTNGIAINAVVKKTPKDKLKQIQKANECLKEFWKEGFELYTLLTDKVHIVQSNGLVSYSHFQEQGISYINFIDRDLLESVDDLVHENAHHHLNLILKKYKLLKKDFKEEIFYSPWRKSLRPLYAILHATFTFSYGAVLFHWMAKVDKWDLFEMDDSYKERAYFRFAEESLMVQYSLYDLNWAIGKGLFTARGIGLVKSLEIYNSECMSYFPEVNKKIKSKEMKKNLVSLQKTLQQKRKMYEQKEIR